MKILLTLDHYFSSENEEKDEEAELYSSLNDDNMIDALFGSEDEEESDDFEFNIRNLDGGTYLFIHGNNSKE